MRIDEMTEGTKIAYKQKGTKLDFADGALTVDLARWQEDDPVTVDIKATRKGNLTTGKGSYYVAQVDIPSREYTEPPEAESATESGESGGAGGSSAGERQPLPLDMRKVVLHLFSIDGIYIR